jgi:ribulose-phosphate 3-epimerase
LTSILAWVYLKAMKKLIAPSLLSADFARLGEELAAVEEAGADLIHVDVMDGQFVPDITIGPLVTAALSKIAKIPRDVHLMVREPDHMLDRFIDAGASYLTVHAEACTHLDRTLAYIRSRGCMAGVALNPATPVTMIQHLVDRVDMILIMSVNPGFGGQAFIDYSLEKIRTVKDMISGLPKPPVIEVDGGVKPDNAAAIGAAGADILVAGSAVFNTADYAASIAAIRNKAGA